MQLRRCVMALLAIAGLTVAAPAPVTAAAPSTPQPATRVELPEAGDEREVVYRNPNGTMTSEVHAVPVRVRRGHGWVPVDATLRVNADGSVGPVAAVAELRLSGGGPGPLVTLASGGRRIGLTWPGGALPVPVLSGDTATYPDVLPGVDLRVTVDAGGFRELLVVKDRVAALNPALREVRFGLVADGVRPEVTPAGGLQAKDRTGTVVFAGAAPAMWESDATPVHRPARGAALDAADAAPGRRAVMPTRIRGNELTIVPDRAILTDPAARFPIVIDPTWSDVGNFDWTMINATAPNQSYWNFDRNDGGAKVGHSPPKASPVVLYRSFFLFGFQGWQGRTVFEARLLIDLDWSSSCGLTNTQLHKTRNISRAEPVTWNTSSDGNTWRGHLSTASGRANDSDNCSSPLSSMTMVFHNVGGAVQEATSTGQLTLGLTAQSESAGNYEWKKFYPMSARVSVNWNLPPNLPNSLSTVPPTRCGSQSSPMPLNTATPTFSARVSDPNYDNAYMRLDLREGTTSVHMVDTAWLTTGGVVAWPAVPPGKLPVDDPTRVFSYQAVAADGYAASAYTSPCYFTVDTRIPGTPIVESADFPDGEPVLPVGRVGTITLKPGYSPITGLPDTDVGGYRYGFQQDKLTDWVISSLNGQATIPMVLWTTARTLYVQAVDRAGNPSVNDTPCICTAWDLRAVSSGAVPARLKQDVNGDGLADVSTIFDMGDARSAAWTVIAQAGGGFYRGYVGWDTGINGGFPGYRTKHVRGDFTGDGLADIAVFREDPDRRLRLFLLKSDGHRYDAGPAPVWEGPVNSPHWTLTNIQPGAGDADGDGRQDILAFVALGPTEFAEFVFPNTGGSLGGPVEWYRNPVGWAEPRRARAIFGDFNGDGTTDVGSFYDYNGLPEGRGRTRLWINYSTGTTFGASGTSKGVWDSGMDNVYLDRLRPVVADVTGDGVDDIVGSYDYSDQYTHLWHWRGERNDTVTSATVPWWDGLSTGTAFRASRAQLHAGDFNGDGRTDIAAIYRYVLPPDGPDTRLHVFLTNSSGTGAVTPNFATPSWENHLGRRDAEVTPEPGKQYWLIATHSNRCLNVEGGGTNVNARIIQYDCIEGAANERFEFVRMGNGPYYQIRIPYSGQCLNVWGAWQGDDVQLAQYPCSSGPGQGFGNEMFRLEYLVQSGLDVIVRPRPAHSDKCIDVYAAATGNGALVKQWTCYGGGNQHFYLRLKS